MNNDQSATIYRGHIPFVRLLLALLAGVILARFVVPQQTAYRVAWVMLALAVMAFIIIKWFTRLRHYRYYGLLGFLALLTVGAIGFIRTWQPHPAIDGAHFSRHKANVLLGYVADEPIVRGDRVRFPFRVTGIYGVEGLKRTSGKLMVTVAGMDSRSLLSLAYGDEFILSANYQDVRPPYNPGELDYKRFLANKHIWHQAYCGFDQIKQVGKGKGSTLLAYALRLRRRMVGKFSRYITDKDALSVASTLVLGYRADLSEPLLQAFSSTGTIHVLSVSGMHVVMLFWLLNKLFWWAGYNRQLRIARFAAMLLVIWGYALLTGLSPSVLRASFMISFVIAADAFRRQNRIYNSIAASAFFLLLYDPQFVADIGFQLSYLAVLGIVWLFPLLGNITVATYRFTKPVIDAAGVSIAAQAGAGPLAAYYFHQFPLYFLLANLLILLPVGLSMYLGFALLVLPSGQLAFWTGYALQETVILINTILTKIEQFPKASIAGLWPSWWDEVLIYWLMVALTIAFVKRRKCWFYGALMCSALLICSSTVATVQRLYSEELIVFNVRRNLAVGFHKGGKTWVYTDLPSPEDRTYRYSVLPGLEQRMLTDSIQFISSVSEYHDNMVYVKGNILQFGHMRLVVYDTTKTFEGRIETDILLFRENAGITLEKLSATIRCKQLLLDGSNSNVTIKRLEKEGRQLGIPVYTLKNNNAYVIGR